MCGFQLCELQVSEAHGIAVELMAVVDLFPPLEVDRRQAERASISLTVSSKSIASRQGSELMVTPGENQRYCSAISQPRMVMSSAFGEGHLPGAALGLRLHSKLRR